MATEQVSIAMLAPQIGVTRQTALHPLSPITAAEITQSRDLIRALYPSATNLQFKAISLEEPEKAQLVPYLEAEHSGDRLPRIDRKAFVCYYIRNTVSQDRSAVFSPQVSELGLKRCV